MNTFHLGFLVPIVLGVFYSSSLVEAKEVKVSVSGQLMCGETALKDAIIKVKDEDLISDDTLGETKSDARGRFSLSITDQRWGQLDGIVTIKHSCRKRFGMWKTDKFYLSNSIVNAGNPIDMGILNMEIDYKRR